MSIGFDVFDKTDANPWLFLQHRARSSFSQFGEDGIIANIFEKIGTTSRWCFEVGANDGVWFSNTKELRDAGWSAVLMESDAAAFAQLLPHRAAGTYCVSVRVGPPPNSIDEVLKACDVPREIDFGSIDIDSDDYWVWADMTEYAPRVMCVEIHPYNVGAFGERWSGSQAGQTAICELGESKGYVPIGRTYCNVIFIRKDCYGGSREGAA